MAQEITFSEAKSNPELRQAYFNSLMPQCPESVQAIIYDPIWTNYHSYAKTLIKEGHIDRSLFNLEKPQSTRIYFKVLYSYSLLGLGRTHPIFVFDYAFDKGWDEPKFLNSLLDHEAYHTDDLMYGVRIQNILINNANVNGLNNITFKFLLEFRAYKNQLRMLEERGIQDKDFENLISLNIDICERELSSVNPISELERKVLERYVIN